MRAVHLQSPGVSQVLDSNYVILRLFGRLRPTVEG